jgi:Asp/Glu/hydantoin racemase
VIDVVNIPKGPASIESHCDEIVASVRDVDTPVLELNDKGVLESKLLGQIEKAVVEDGAEAVVLGCTGMLGLAQSRIAYMAPPHKERRF